MTSAIGQAKVSDRGQMALPASARHRWGLDDGGQVAWIDLGDAIILVPGGLERARAMILDELGDADWAAAAQGFGDPGLANQ